MYVAYLCGCLVCLFPQVINIDLNHVCNVSYATNKNGFHQALWYCSLSLAGNLSYQPHLCLTHYDNTVVESLTRQRQAPIWSILYYIMWISLPHNENNIWPFECVFPTNKTEANDFWFVKSVGICLILWSSGSDSVTLLSEIVSFWFSCWLFHQAVSA